MKAIFVDDHFYESNNDEIMVIPLLADGLLDRVMYDMDEKSLSIDNDEI